MPKRWHTREDSGIRLDREGRWWHDGEPVEHPRIIEAFNRGLAPSEDGRYKLNVGKDWCYVEVEGAAYRVTSVHPKDDGPPVLELSDGSAEPLDPQTLTADDEGVLECQVKERRASARFSRDAQAAMGELLEQTKDGVCLRIGEERVPLPVFLASLPGRGP
jgi:uncharacterized protein